jgi:hypothetical protein
MQSARTGRRVWGTNANTSSFASKIPTVTEPTNDGVLNLNPVVSGTCVPRWARILVIGLGADNDVASMRVIGWCKVKKDGSTDLWVPVVIGEFACTFSAAVGVAGAAVLNTERFADTITPVAARLRDDVIAAGTAINSEYGVLSPTGDLVAHIMLPISAFDKLEFCFDQTTNSPTCNAIVTLIDN